MRVGWLRGCSSVRRSRGQVGRRGDEDCQCQHSVCMTSVFYKDAHDRSCMLREKMIFDGMETSYSSFCGPYMFSPVAVVYARSMGRPSTSPTINRPFCSVDNSLLSTGEVGDHSSTGETGLVNSLR